MTGRNTKRKKHEKVLMGRIKQKMFKIGIIFQTGKRKNKPNR